MNDNNKTIEKYFYDKFDIMQMYDCSETIALGYIRAIRETCGGGKLSKGKVLPSELEYWQTLIPVKEVKQNDKIQAQSRGLRILENKPWKYR